MKTTMQLLELMSPTTLASLISDLRQMDNRDSEAEVLEYTANELLCAIEGEEDAAKLINELAGYVPESL